MMAGPGEPTASTPPSVASTLLGVAGVAKMGDLDAAAFDASGAASVGTAPGATTGGGLDTGAGLGLGAAMAAAAGASGGPHTAAASAPGITFGTPGALSNAAQRLGKVAEKFSTFYNDLESERHVRRQSEQSRYAQLTDTIFRVEQNLELEIKRRAESDRNLQLAVGAELKSLNERMQTQAEETQKSFKNTVDALSRSFAELSGSVREEREQRAAQMEQLAQRLMLKLDGSTQGLEAERVSRLEREAQTLKRVGEDIFRLQERIESEKAHREASLHSLQSEVNELAGGRSLGDEKFQALVLTEIASLKQKIQAERDERVSEDEQIVLAINDYTKALQDGLRIVSSG